MKVYESEGKFDSQQQNFYLKVQTTNISPDEFKITKFYNICNESRYAIVGILQTEDGNATDFSNYPPDSFLEIENYLFSDLDKSYLKEGDKDITAIKEGDTIVVYIHHGIGFDPETNADDNLYLENYKKGVYVHLQAGSPPGSNGGGNMPG
jgi:hypothetical protein